MWLFGVHAGKNIAGSSLSTTYCTRRNIIYTSVLAVFLRDTHWLSCRKLKTRVRLLYAVGTRITGDIAASFPFLTIPKCCLFSRNVNAEMP